MYIQIIKFDSWVPYGRTPYKRMEKTLLESRKMSIFASYRDGSSFGTQVFDK